MEEPAFFQNHILPVGTSLHWTYSLHGYENYSIKRDGIPIITHLHGGHTNFQFDGNPEWFYTWGNRVVGPSWDDEGVPFTTRFTYDVDVPAGNLWYHDHALGITRLNVYAGMSGFFFVRDDEDTGKPDNPLGLPAFPYEAAYALQDRMFKRNGQLFYPAFPGDPFYEGFITEEGAILPTDLFPGGGPTALAEFFGDHMVVNGMIWPKTDVEPRNYRMHLLNGHDSRFLALQFRVVGPNDTNLDNADAPLPFWVIGSDQGLASAATQVDTLVVEPGGRYDVVFDFSQVAPDYRVIMSNEGWDGPFGGDFGRIDTNPDPDELFPNSQTDRIMAFDVVLPMDITVPDDFDPDRISHFGGNPNTATNTRRVALFEGKDEFGRLQPLLGTVDETPNGFGSIATPYTWANPDTEEPELVSTEVWEINNFTGVAHPVHLHLVQFQILGRKEIFFDSDDGDPGHDVLMHNGALGVAPVITNLETGVDVTLGPDDGYVENAPKDMVTALPGQVTTIKVTFDKPGKYVWHCHILSHEDHEMMRVMRVVEPSP